MDFDSEWPEDFRQLIEKWRGFIAGTTQDIIQKYLVIMENSKRTIAIVCGGDSSEHDVSLRSGQGLYSFFDKERYNIYLVDVKGTDWHVALDNGETIEIDKNDFSFVMNGKHVYFDYAYITIHGQPGENGVMQATLTSSICHTLQAVFW